MAHSEAEVAVADVNVDAVAVAGAESDANAPATAAAASADAELELELVPIGAMFRHTTGAEKLLYVFANRNHCRVRGRRHLPAVLDLLW